MLHFYLSFFIIPKCTLQVGEVPCLGKCVKYPFLIPFSVFSSSPHLGISLLIATPQIPKSSPVFPLLCLSLDLTSSL